MRQVVATFAGTALVLFVVAATAAQQPAAAFDAASIRPGAPGALGGDWVFRQGGRFSAENATLLELIRAAWNMDTYRIVGGPDWMRRDRFTIEARPASAVTIDEARLMLRTLLADRFRLRAATASRDLPIYHLVLHQRDGRAGPQLRPAPPGTCAERDAQAGTAPAMSVCGRVGTNPGRMSGRSTPLSRLTAALATLTGRVVVDRTGLTGLFDLDMKWALTEAEVATLVAQFGRARAVDPDEPSLFGALQEQLGLRLDAATGPVDVLVVESGERPTEN